MFSNSPFSLCVYGADAKDRMAETSEMNMIFKALDEKSWNNPIRQEN